MNERLTWDEMVAKYPDKHVIIEDYISERNADIVEGTVIGVYNDDEVDAAYLKFLKEGRNCIPMRTSMGVNVGVIVDGNRYN